jgi:serine/threonine protein kinase
MAQDLIGKRIGGCEIISIVGRGGMAVVYRAHQISMNRPVAIKILPRQFVDDETYMQRFEREVRIVAQLEHRNIVPVHDYGEHEGQPYIVMRYMDDGSIDDLIRQHRRLPLPLVINYISQVAPALDYAHSKGVLHRDLKPSNILLDDDGGAYLTDFGIALLMNDTGRGLTVQGVIGTPSYMSPEQAQGKPLDARSDVYALGVTIFEMVTGTRPFDGDTPYSIAVAQVTQPPPHPRRINPALPAAVEQVILKAMSKRPEERYPNAIALADALAAAGGMNTPQADPLLDTLPNPVLASVNTTVPGSPNIQPIQPSPTAGVPTIPPIPPAVFTPASAFDAARPRSVIAPVTGALFGAGIGCLLLVLLAGAALLLLNLPAVSVAVATPVPTIPPASGALTTATPAAAAPTSAERIVFAAEREGSFDIYLLDMDTLIETRLTNIPANVMYPAPSPDGRLIAFQSDQDGDFDIYVMNADGSNVRRITNNTTGDRHPAWSPDGEWLVFASDTDGNGSYNLYRARLDGSEYGPLHRDDQHILFPRYSPDGRYVLFTSGRADDAATWVLRRLDTRTGALITLGGAVGKRWGASYTSSGEIVALAEGNGYSAIVRMNADGREQRVLYDGTGYESGADMHPNMVQVVFASDATGRDELYLLILNGTTARQITQFGGHAPRWMP